MITLDQLVDLAIDTQKDSPINWGKLNISEEHAYKMIAASVHEQFATKEITTEQYYAMLAVVVNLTVENFALNLKIESGQV